MCIGAYVGGIRYNGSDVGGIGGIGANVEVLVIGYEIYKFLIRWGYREGIKGITIKVIPITSKSIISNYLNLYLLHLLLLLYI